MEKTGITITKRKDGRYVGKFIVEYADNGKAQYHYVYGKTYEEAENKVLIGREIATRYLSGRYITVGKVYLEWCKKSSKTYNFSPENIQAVRHKVYKANA